MSVARATSVQVRNRSFLAAWATLLLVVSSSQAAWLGYKNETRVPVVVQTTIVVNNQIVRGKAHVLYSGEIAWDNIPAPGVRQISIYDPKANNKLMHQENVVIQNQDIFLGVRLDIPAQQPGKPAPQPVVKLVAVKLPGPPGVVPQPQGQPKTNPNAPATPIPVRPPQEQPKTPPAAPKSPTAPAIPVKPGTPPPSTPPSTAPSPSPSPPAKKPGN